MARKFKLDDLTKVESSTVGSLARTTDDMIQAIVKVKPAGYVPKNVRVRARIDDHLLTCEFQKNVLASLEGDSQVESVSISKGLKLVE